MTTRTTEPRFGRLDRIVVRLEGEAVRRFANGMFTNNARDLPIHAHQATAFADDRGRLQGLADLWCEAQDSLLLALDGLDAEGFTELFRLHLMLDDIELSTPDLGLWFTDGTAMAPSWTVPGGTAFLAAIAPDAPFAPGEVDAIRIAAGVPCFRDASAKQLPHELGLRTTHLHFEKGCYRGQEIIHRIDVMGGVRKALTGVVLSANAAGEALTSDGKKAGRLGTFAQHHDHGRIGLAVVRNELRAPGTVLGCGPGTATVHTLPFP